MITEFAFNFLGVFSQVGLPGPEFTQRHHPRTDLDALSSKMATRAPHEARKASKNAFLKNSPGLRPGPRFSLLSLPSSYRLTATNHPAPHLPTPADLPRSSAYTFGTTIKKTCRPQRHLTPKPQSKISNPELSDSVVITFFFAMITLTETARPRGRNRNPSENPEIFPSPT